MADDPADRDWQEVLVPIAERAGEAILEIYETEEFDVTSKADQSPLTEADLAAEQAITEDLREATPKIPILSEEAKDAPFRTREDWDRLWVVDPLDGTKEFLKQNDEFTVNIALVEGHAPVAGVVHVPALETTYYGQEGRGVRLDADGETELSTDPIDPEGTIRVVASRSHLDDETKAFVDDLDDAELVRTGSSLKFCRIADGDADLYPRFAPTMEWDTAAAQAVLEAAGGEVRRKDGRPMRYNKPDLMNPHFLASGDPSWFD